MQLWANYFRHKPQHTGLLICVSLSLVSIWSPRSFKHFFETTGTNGTIRTIIWKPGFTWHSVYIGYFFGGSAGIDNCSFCFVEICKQEQNRLQSKPKGLSKVIECENFSLSDSNNIATSIRSYKNTRGPLHAFISRVNRSAFTGTSRDPTDQVTIYWTYHRWPKLTMRGVILFLFTCTPRFTEWNMTIELELELYW